MLQTAGGRVQGRGWDPTALRGAPRRPAPRRPEGAGAEGRKSRVTGQGGKLRQGRRSGCNSRQGVASVGAGAGQGGRVGGWDRVGGTR